MKENCLSTDNDRGDQFNDLNDSKLGQETAMFEFEIKKIPFKRKVIRNKEINVSFGKKEEEPQTEIIKKERKGWKETKSTIISQRQSEPKRRIKHHGEPTTLSKLFDSQIKTPKQNYPVEDYPGILTHVIIK